MNDLIKLLQDLASAIDALKAQLVDAQAAAQGAYDKGFSDGVASVVVDPGKVFSQADLDAAVKAAVDPLNVQVAAIQSALDAETVKDQGDAALAASLQSKIDQIKLLVD